MKKLITTLLLTGCFCALAGEISDAYFKKVEANLEKWMKARQASRANTSISGTNYGITQIGIERTLCYGSCPAYTFIVKSDGTFRYQGDKYVERIGEFSGTVSVRDFNRLAQFIKESGYMDLADTYEEQMTDLPTVFSMVVMKGRQKIISDYADAGPSKLWAMEQLIDHLMAGAHWNERSTAQAPRK